MKLFIAWVTWVIILPILVIDGRVPHAWYVMGVIVALIIFLTALSQEPDGSKSYWER